MRLNRRATVAAPEASASERRERIGVVASRRETRDGLARYLRETGFQADELTALDARDLDDDARALVVFPDDFELRAVRRFVQALRSARPRVLIVVVTRAAVVLERVLAPEDDTTTPVILPRPPFGWSIVDVLRGHLSGEAR